MKIARAITVLFLFTSCGTIVNYDYEPSTDFTQYKTYNYFDDMQTGLSVLDTKRIIRAIDSKLQTMGFKRTENADFYIDIQSQNIMNRNNPNVGVGVGGTGRNTGGGVSIGIPINSNQNTREVVIDFVDNNKEITFWQAISESAYNPNAKPEKKEAYFTVLIEKIFSKYPPAVKKP